MKPHDITKTDAKRVQEGAVLDDSTLAIEQLFEFMTHRIFLNSLYGKLARSAPASIFEHMRKNETARYQ